MKFIVLTFSFVVIVAFMLLSKKQNKDLHIDITESEINKEKSFRLLRERLKK
ncbi:MAG: hypothetical protein QXO70_00575 [Candidatus Pacearchaeota archaeon]